MGNDWPIVKLGDYCKKIGSGATPKGGSSVYLDLGDVCLIRSQNIYNEGFSESGLVYIDDIAATKLKNVEVEKNDVLLNITGDSVARVCLAPSDFLPARVNQHVAIIRPNAAEFDARFLRYLLASPKTQKLLLNLASAGATRNALTKGMIEDFEVSKPPVSVQTGIANLLESLDNKITLNRQINQTLEQMAQTLFKSWFVDFDPVMDNALDAGNPIPDELQHRAETRKTVRESEGFKPLPEDVRQLFPDAFEESELGWVPKGWVMKAVSDALTINPKVQLSKGQNAHFVDMKALPTSGYSIEEVIHKAFSGGAKFEQNDVLLARITPCLQNGKTGFVDFLGEGEVGFGSTEFIVLRGDKDVHHTYIACLARHEKFRQHAMQSMVGSSGRQRVQNSCFDDYFIAVPTDDVMKKFAQMTKPSFDKFKANTAESIALAELRDTLLPKLISGELRLDEIELAVEQETVSAEQQNER